MDYNNRLLSGAWSTVRSIRLFVAIVLMIDAVPLGCLGFKPQRKNEAAVQQRREKNSREVQSLRDGNTMISRRIETIFNDADTNNDGSVEIAEAYTLVLKMYIYINRQAPVSPPTPEKVRQMFEMADADHNGRLDLEEFRRLMLLSYKKNSTRIVAFKIFRHVLAPLLALQTFATITNIRSSWMIFSEFVLLEHVPYYTYISQRYDLQQLWKTALVVVYAAFLGNLALHITDFFLDKFQLFSEQRSN